jgi:adenylate cyclase
VSIESVERRLSAVLSADAVGYSRLIAEDEVATVRRLSAYLEEIGVLVRQHLGRVVDAPGDNLLAEFPSAIQAASCAVEIQRVLAARNADLPPERKLEFRIGVHLGDLMVEGEKIYGDGVNIAARIEGLAEPGGVSVSAAIHEQIRHKLDLGFEDCGPHSLKNIPEPVRVFRIRPGSGGAGSQRPAPAARTRLRTAAVAVGAVALVIAIALAATWPRPLGLVLLLAGLAGPPVDPPLPDEPSLVVLPFDNMSDDPEQEYFSDGITEDLTTALSMVPGLFVIARNSAFTYKGQPVKVERVGRELGVRYVLEGSVRKAGETVRFNAQLIDATTGYHLWSQRYDRELSDIFALQTEITEKILEVLPVEIREAEFDRVRRGRPESASAYDDYVRALYLFSQVTRQGHAEARRLCRGVVERDPGHAKCHALLGATYSAEHVLGWNFDPALLQRAEEFVRRAIELDPFLPHGHVALAQIAYLRRRPEEAMAAAERAVELAPNLDMAHVMLGFAQASAGQTVDALGSIRRSLRLNPRAPGPVWGVLGVLNMRAGREREAVELWERVRTAYPELVLIRVLLADHYERSGRHAEAAAAVREIQRVNPEIDAERAAALSPLIPAEARPEAAEILRRAGLP